MTENIQPTAPSSAPIDAATLLAGDRQLMATLIDHLKDPQTQREPAMLMVPINSTLGQWLSVYHTAIHRPRFLAWAKQQALNLSSLTLHRTTLKEGDGAKRAFTFTEHAEWRRLATAIVAIAEVIDPDATGLPWPSTEHSLRALPVARVLRFYGATFPNTAAQRFVVLSALAHMSPFDTSVLNEAFKQLNADLQQLAQTLESLVSAHFSAVDHSPFSLLSPYKTRLRLRSTSCLARAVKTGAALIDVITHHADFLALSEVQDLQPGHYHFAGQSGVLRAEHVFGMNIDIDLERLRALTPSDSVQQLTSATEHLHIPIHQDETLSVADLLTHHGLPMPGTVEEAEELAKQLRRTAPLAIPAIDDRAASAIAITDYRRQRVIDNERDRMHMALRDLIKGKAPTTTIDPQSVWVEPEPDHCTTSGLLNLETLLKRHGITVAYTVDEAHKLLPLLDMTRPASPALGSYWQAIGSSRPSGLELSNAQHTIVLDTVASMQPLNSPGLFNLLAEGLVSGMSREQAQVNAETLIKQMLDQPRAQTLGCQLIKALGWAGGVEGEAEHTRTSRDALVLAALILTLDPQAGKQRYVIAGLDLNTQHYWGMPCKHLRNNLEVHLVRTGLVSPQATPVATHLLLAGAAPECLVQDVPGMLRFMSSHAWMLFKQGVMQIEEVASGASRQMSFNDIVVFAAQVPTTAEQQQWHEHCALSTLIDWSVASGALPRPDQDTVLGLDQINLLKANLNRRIALLQRATHQLASEPPSRRRMAIKDLRKAYPDNRLLKKKCLLWKDRNHNASHTHLGPLPRKFSEGTLHSAVDLHMSGALIPLAGQLETTDPDFDLERLKKGITELGDINARFAVVFAGYIDSIKAAYSLYIQYLLCQLPLKDRQELEQGQLQFLILTEPAKKPLDLESPHQRHARTGRYGVILRCERGQAVRYFELFALINMIRENTELPRQLLIGGELFSFTTGSAHSARPASTVFRGTQLPVDWQAYSKGQQPRPGQRSTVIVEQLINVPPQAPPETAAPMDFDAPRTRHLADTLVEKHFFLELDSLLAQAKGASTLEQNQQLGEQVLAIVKALIPFWSCSEDLASGDLKRTIDGAYGCFIDVLGVYAPTKAGLLSASARLASKAPVPLKLLQLVRLGASYLHAILNPLDGAGSLFKLTRYGVAYLSKASQQAMLTAIGQTRKWLTHTSAFDTIKHLRRIDIASGTLMRGTELTRLMAIMHKNRWHGFEPFSTRAQGPVLNGFQPDNAITVTALTLADGYQARVVESALDAPLMIHRSTGTDVLTGGKVLRLNPDNPALLTDLTSASHFRTAESFDSLCPVSRQKRSPIPLICFTKKLYLFRRSIHKRRVQAMEHLRLMPAPIIAGQTRKTVYNRVVYEAIPQVTSFELNPVAVQLLPVVYKHRTTGRFILDEPQFGLPKDDLDNLLSRETAVVEVHGIVEGIDDQRVMRALLLNNPSAQPAPKTLCVVEADVGVFYQATPDATANQALHWDLLEYGTSPETNRLIDAYATQKNRHLVKANSTEAMPLVVLPTLEVLYRQLRNRGYTAQQIERIRHRASSLSTLKQRDFLLNTSDQGRALDIQVAALPIQLQVWAPRPLQPAHPSAAQTNQYIAETANNAVQTLVERTGLKSANILGSTPEEITRMELTEPVVMWEYSKIDHPDYTGVILRTGAGNCDQMAHIACELIRHNRGTCQLWCIERAHTFVVVGAPPVTQTLNFNEYGWDDAWVCDPWVGIACPAPVYLQRLKDKMKTMHDENILIFFRDGPEQRWGSANDPVWLAQLDDHLKRSID